MIYLQNPQRHFIHYYTHDRIKEKLQGMSPVRYRTHALKAA
ncbi:IS3 family transposase [Paenibacillus sp. LjRoot153]